jgi:rsbT co-antagonist protein RsbR
MDRASSTPQLASIGAELQQMLSSSPRSFYCLMNTDGVVVASAGGALTSLGLSPTSGLGQPLSAVFPEVPEVAAQLASALAGEPQVTGLWRHGGRVFDTHLAAARGPQGGDVLGAVLIGHDVTAMAEAAAAGRWSEGVLNHVAKGAPVVISVYNKEGVFTTHIGKGLEKLGLQQNQLAGQSVFDAFAGADEALTRIRGALSGQESTNTQDLGGTIWDNWFSPIRDEEQKIIGALSISTDVTARERARLALRERLSRIEEQDRTIREMAAPILQVWQGILVVPVVGQLTSERVELITTMLLDAIVKTRARAAILDLTAVTQVDSATADHLLRILRAVTLLGARGLLSGIAPAVAQTVVAMGINLSEITTVASLHDALRLLMTPT